MEEIGKTYEPLLPTQPYVEERPETSQNSILVTRSKAKDQMEETSESIEEEFKPLTRKGRKLDKFYREQETTRDKVEGKQTSLDHLVKPLLPKKKTGEQPEGRKDIVGSLPFKKE